MTIYFKREVKGGTAFAAQNDEPLPKNAVKIDQGEFDAFEKEQDDAFRKMQEDTAKAEGRTK